MARNPTSAVFDFTFDYDISKIKRDAGSLSMRVDYSNAGGEFDPSIRSRGPKELTLLSGYWDAVVKAAGITTRDLHNRFFSSSTSGTFDLSGYTLALRPSGSEHNDYLMTSTASQTSYILSLYGSYL